MIPLYKPFVPPLPKIHEVLSSGQLAYGKYGKMLESKLSNFIGNPLFLVTNNYSNAILVALLTLGIKTGDKVVISPLICLATSQPIAALGIELVFCDVNEDNGSLDSKELYNILQSNKIACVVFTHYAGIVGDVEGIKNLCLTHSVPVIEDASDAFGSKYKGKYIGNCGFDITVFSFSAVRNPNMIDAGGISFAKRDLYERAYLTRDAGIDRTGFRNQLGEIDLLSDVILPGISATLDEVRSYIGLKQLEVLEEIILINKTNMNSVLNQIVHSNMIRPILPQFSESNGWILPLHVNDKLELIKLLSESGVSSSGVHGNISYYSIYGSSKRMEKAEIFLDKFLAIPCGWWIDDINEFNLVLAKVIR